MQSTGPHIVELKGYQHLRQGGLLPAIRRAVQEARLDDRQQLADIGLSRQGERLYLYLYYMPLEEGVSH